MASGAILKLSDFRAEKNRGMRWRSVPFLRLVFPLAAGIYFGDRLVEADLCWGAAWWMGWLVLGGWHRRRLSFGQRRWYGLLLFLLVFALGGWVGRRSDLRTRSNHFEHYLKGGPALVGSVRTVVPSNSGWRLMVQVEKAVAPPEERAVTGRLLVYLPPSARPRPGRRMSCRGTVRELRPPRNPAAFDFARYMAIRGVYHVVYARRGGCVLLPVTGPADWQLRAAEWQRRGVAVLKQHLGTGDAHAVAAALTLGYREAVPESLRTAYQNTGAIHILAVSGLHVGLVYLALNSLLRLLPPLRHRRLLEMVGCLTGVWAFVAVTGLPPSAVRAGTMFSFFILGRAFFRQSNAFNTLAASAFCLLLIQPRLLFDVGFQLSYAAVAGIIALQPLLYRAWFLPWAVPDYLWKLLSVSIAAQVGTLPLSLFYFHQFPTYFWLSGLIAVPAAGVILGGGLLLLLLQALPGASAFLGSLLEELINCLNAAIDQIAALPGGQIKDLWLQAPLVAGYYLFLLLLLLGGHLKVRRCWLAAALVLALCSTYNGLRRSSILRQRQLVLYQVPGHTLIDLFSGRDCYTLASGGLEKKTKHFAAGNYRLSRNLRACRSLPLPDTSLVSLQVGSRRVLLIPPSLPLSALPRLETDVAVIRGDPPWSMAELQGRLTAGLLLFDASCAPARIRQWRRECRRHGQPCHAVSESGALILSIHHLKPVINERKRK